MSKETRKRISNLETRSSTPEEVILRIFTGVPPALEDDPSSEGKPLKPIILRLKPRMEDL